MMISTSATRCMPSPHHTSRGDTWQVHLTVGELRAFVDEELAAVTDQVRNLPRSPHISPHLPPPPAFHLLLRLSIAPRRYTSADGHTPPRGDGAARAPPRVPHRTQLPCSSRPCGRGDHPSSRRCEPDACRRTPTPCPASAQGGHALAPAKGGGMLTSDVHHSISPKLTPFAHPRSHLTAPTGGTRLTAPTVAPASQPTMRMCSPPSYRPG